MFYAVYVGSSMNPTLREPEIMEVVPCGGRPPGVGDVALFLLPAADGPVVHRIVRVTPAGLRTRGDNNAFEDACLLPPESIQGRVVAAWRGQRRRKIMGGVQGQMTGLWLRGRRVLGRMAAPLLLPAYRALSEWGGIARALPVAFRPRVFVFQSRGQDQFHLLLGPHVIGRYDDQRRQWQIHRPFHLLVDRRMLPGQPEFDGPNPSRSLGDHHP